MRANSDFLTTYCSLVTLLNCLLRNRTGNFFDSAVAVSFFATLEQELTGQRSLLKTGCVW